VTSEPDRLAALIAALDQAAADLRANYRTGDRSIEYINGFEDAAAFAEGWAAADHHARLAAGTDDPYEGYGPCFCLGCIGGSTCEHAAGTEEG
jgi:hypothetical protein